LFSHGIIPISLATCLPVAKRLGSPRNTSVARAVTAPTPGLVSGAPGPFVGPGPPLPGPVLGSTFAIARTNRVARFVFDRCRVVVEASFGVRSAPPCSTAHGLDA